MARASKIYASLDRRPTTMGLNTTVFMMMATLGAILFMTQVYFILPLFIPLYLLLRHLHKKDDLWMVAYLRYSDEGDVYDPWPRAAVVAKRPKGFGKGLLC